MSRVREDKNLIVGLDIGTSKIVAIAAEILPEGTLKVIGVGQHASRGLKKGVVVNIDSTMQAIQRAIEEVELMADCKINTVYSGIAGSHIKSLNSHGMVKIKESEVSQMDIDRVVETARAIALPADQQILHILTQEFIIDGQEDVREPLGMSGIRLEVRVHIVTGAIAAAQNIVKCIKRCGLEVSDLILQPLASSESVLTDDEKELGVCLVDIGGGTTDLAVFKNGAIRHTAVIPIAGDQITNDIAVALRTPTQSAEEIKVKHGCALRQLADPREVVEVPAVDGREPRQLSCQALTEVIEDRVEEIYEFVQQELRRSGMESMIASGIVITGGAAQMRGMVELGEEIFHTPVRLGVPRGVEGLSEVVGNPRYATGIGLLLMAKQQVEKQMVGNLQSGSVGRLLERMKSWFTGNF
ncbi:MULTISPECIES: cell division protein FtsA [unclassified Methylophilus]|jgi:cell division protein FtsA|uniref:cell division protein FtsA n=1 Tax=unclassified Methylophilus TaxID=2630143 RepID=UPI00037A7B7B|nr:MULTISPECIES: cell division protein FtsA [unclassified Methylophilus]MBF4987890.1 cell division protein FtsA [Methylophilus sp. 14]MBF4992242.1 cell division protein FtsA [Methylophilus sp. QUAN]TXI44416.1 MAG: cell division protein FtsA [Methylophilus sp.]HCU85396.1 cell division protein FtsA [Methylophilus sp.]HWU66733.1 cell division protein FtsA [Methylophilus sp.]